MPDPVATAIRRATAEVQQTIDAAWRDASAADPTDGARVRFGIAMLGQTAGELAGDRPIEPAVLDALAEHPITQPMVSLARVLPAEPEALPVGSAADRSAWWLGCVVQAVRNAVAQGPSDKGYRRATVDRKSAGIFFTPPELCRPTVRRAIPRAGRDTTVLDPACGAGAFLVAALDRLGPSALPRVHGIDRDPIAATAARLALYLAARPADPAVLRETIRCADALAMDPAPAYDAVIGNPPWETVQAESTEFFVALDPTYRQLDKRRALARQTELLAAPSVRQRWDAYRAEREVERASLRARYPIASHGKVYTYKYFVEHGLRSLRVGGRLAMIVPSGLYTDDGSAALRRWIGETAAWEWLYAFENRRRIFPIDSRYKFAIAILRRSTSTDRRPAQVAFGQTDLAGWSSPTPPTIAVPPEELAVLRSAETLAWPELTDAAQVTALREIAEAGRPLGAMEGVSFTQGINLTTANRHAAFEPADASPWRGGSCTPTGRWRPRRRHIKFEEAWPLLQGAMFHAYQPLYQAWQSGHGRGVVWRRLPEDRPADEPMQPQYVMREPAWQHAQPDLVPMLARAHRIAFRNTGSSSNERSMIATIAPPIPCGNSAQTLRAPGDDLRWSLQLLAVLNSLPFDFALRARMGSPNLNWFLVREVPVPRGLAVELDPVLVRLAARLALSHRLFAPCWLWLRAADPTWGERSPGEWMALDDASRRAIRLALEVRVGRAYRLSPASIARIARPDREDPKGFWRIDAERPEEDRLPVRWQAAMHAGDEELAEPPCNGVGAPFSWADAEADALGIVGGTERLAEYLAAAKACSAGPESASPR